MTDGKKTNPLNPLSDDAKADLSPVQAHLSTCPQRYAKTAGPCICGAASTRTEAEAREYTAADKLREINAVRHWTETEND